MQGDGGDPTLPAVGAVALAVGVVVYGVRRWYWGWYPPAFVVGCAMVGTGVLAAQRTMWVHAGPTDPGAAANAALFLSAGGGKLAAARFGVDPLGTAGEAVFALAVVHFLARADAA